MMRLLCALLLLTAFARADAPLPKSFNVIAIDAYVADQVKSRGYVGLSLGILRDGKVVFAKGYGHRSLDPKLPADENTAYRIGSISKQFTCAAILLLAEDGKLDVTDKVAKYYPHLTKADEITLLDLMNHTSGYPDYYPLDFVDRRMQKDISAEQLAKDYAGGKLDFEPGSRYSYSNTGYILLGDIVEKVSGQKLGVFLTERIFKPLAMARTRYLDASDLKNRADGYWSFALGPPEKASGEPDGWLAGAGGIWSTVPDLLKWNLALMEGKVFKPATWKLMTAPRELRNGRMSNYGCGLALGEFAGERTLGHNGAVFGYLANNVFFPRSKSAVVLLVNSEHVRPNTLFRSLVELVANDLRGQESPAVPKVEGPEPKEVVLDFLKQMQDGKIDRAKLSEEFNIYLSDERVREAAPRLKALGQPEKVAVGSKGERGGMEVVTVTLTFKDKVVKASLYRTPDGTIQQLIFNAE